MKNVICRKEDRKNTKVPSSPHCYCPYCNVFVSFLLLANPPPSKHRVQQLGKSHSSSGVAPPQSENSCSRFDDVLNSQMDAGILPDRKLNCTMNSVRFFSVPASAAGIVPVSPFPSKYKSFNPSGFEKVAGIVPVSVLFERYSNRREAASKIDVGRVPVNRLLARST